jgi:hypothetical protein
MNADFMVKTSRLCLDVEYRSLASRAVITFAARCVIMTSAGCAVALGNLMEMRPADSMNVISTMKHRWSHIHVLMFWDVSFTITQGLNIISELSRRRSRCELYVNNSWKNILASN